VGSGQSAVANAYLMTLAFQLILAPHIVQSLCSSSNFISLAWPHLKHIDAFVPPLRTSVQAITSNAPSTAANDAGIRRGRYKTRSSSLRSGLAPSRRRSPRLRRKSLRRRCRHLPRRECWPNYSWRPPKTLEPTERTTPCSCGQDDAGAYGSFCGDDTRSDPSH
jgi:hypothetical protein